MKLSRLAVRFTSLSSSLAGKNLGGPYKKQKPRSVYGR
jgi:hypothetical protein